MTDPFIGRRVLVDPFRVPVGSFVAQNAQAGVIGTVIETQPEIRNPLHAETALVEFPKPSQDGRTRFWVPTRALIPFPVEPEKPEDPAEIRNEATRKAEAAERYHQQELIKLGNEIDALKLKLVRHCELYAEARRLKEALKGGENAS